MIVKCAINVGSKLFSKCITQFINYKLSKDCLEKGILVSSIGVLADEGASIITKEITKSFFAQKSLGYRYAKVCSDVINELMSKTKYAYILKEWYEGTRSDDVSIDGNDLKDSLTIWFKHHKSLSPDPDRIINDFIDDFNRCVECRVQNNHELFDFFDSMKKDKTLYEIRTKDTDILSGVEEIKERLDDNNHIIEKKQYPFQENIIPRKVIPYEYIQNAFLYYYKQEALPLLEYCKQERLIVLVDDAASGKTVALKELAAQAYDSEYYPCMVSLSDYTGEEIETMINRECDYDSRYNYILIFDAFDETRADERDTFARKLNVYSRMRVNDIIVVSVRHNFYHYNNNSGTGSTFNDFKEFGLYPLYDEDIDAYLVRNGVAKELMFSELNSAGLMSLLQNPFYLSNLVKIIKNGATLHSKNDLMNEIIKLSFDFDEQKFVNPHIVAESKYELMKLLRTIAIAMQLMENKIFISEENYETLFNKENRELIKHSSLFAKSNENNWSFVHNNFREFLAAEYLNDLSVDEIKDVICSDAEKRKVRSSWLNVLSYLALINENNEILNWLIEVAPELVVKFERSRIEDDKRAKIFIEIINSYTERNMCIYHGVNYVDELVRFGECEETLSYLISELRSTNSKWGIKNALISVSHFSHLFSQNDEIRELLLHIIDNNDDEFVQALAVDAIADLKLNTESSTETVKRLYNDKKVTCIAKSLLKYIYCCGLQDDCIELVLTIKKDFFKREDDYYRLDSEISQIIETIEKNESVKTVINHIIHSDRFRDDIGFLDSLIEKAIHFYNEGDKSFYNLVFSLQIKAIGAFKREYTNKIDYFFETTDTLDMLNNDIIDLFVDKDDKNRLCVYIDLLDNKNSIVNELMRRYIKDPEKYIFFARFFVYSGDEDVYNECYRLMQQREELYQKPPKIDYDEIRSRALQEYVDSLFDKEVYLNNVKSMVSYLGNEDITCGKVLDSILKRYEYGALEYELYHNYSFALYREKSKKKVIDFVEDIQDWTQFCICSVIKVIENKENISFSKEQISFIQKYCSDIKVDQLIEDGISENSPMRLTYNDNIVHFCFLSNYFNFDHPKSIIKKLTVIPSLFFSYEFDKKGISKYLLNRLDKEEMDECIKDNLINRNLCSYSIVEHIAYCKDNMLDYALSAAEELCLADWAYSSDKLIALEYIDMLKNDNANDYSYIYDVFLDNADDSLIEAMIFLTSNKCVPRFVQKLEILNEKSENRTKYLKVLINMQSEYALKEYYRIISTNLAIPELIEGGPHVTFELRNISSINLLPTLIQIKDTLFEDGFKDKRSFGARDAAFQAFLNIASKDSILVRDSIRKCLEADGIKDEDKEYCYVLLERIDGMLERKDDVPWELSRVKIWLNQKNGKRA